MTTLDMSTQQALFLIRSLMCYEDDLMAAEENAHTDSEQDLMDVEKALSIGLRHLITKALNEQGVVVPLIPGKWAR
jgi:hypothetical protein